MIRKRKKEKQKKRNEMRGIIKKNTERETYIPGSLARCFPTMGRRICLAFAQHDLGLRAKQASGQKLEREIIDSRLLSDRSDGKIPR